MTLGEIQNQYERIMQQPEGPERDKSLSDLIDVAKREFDMPLIQNEAWERKNRAVIAMYKKLSMSRSM